MKTLLTSKGKLVLLLSAAAGAAVLILRCANPLDQPPFKWRSKIEVPMTNDSFHIAQKLPDLISSFNDTVVQYWYYEDSIPRYPGYPFTHPRYFSTVWASDTVDTVTHLVVMWKKDHLYKSEGYNKWKDLGEVNADVLMGGYDSANLGITYDINDPDYLITEIDKGDTVILSLRQRDSISYRVTQDSMKTKYFQPSLGPITIGSPDLYTPQTINDSALKKSDTLPLVSALVDTTFNLPFPGITLVAIDPISPPCTVTVRNLSSTATVYNCTLTVFDSVRSFGTLGPGASATRTFPVVSNSGIGVAFGNTIPIRVRQDSASSVSPGDQMAVRVNIVGLIASEVTASNHFITFSKPFINPYVLTDTLETHNIDILDGFFVYAIDNQSALPLQVDVHQLNLWQRDYCMTHVPPLERYTDFVGLPPGDPDTVNRYMGRNVAHLTVGPYSATVDCTLMHTNVNLSEDRLFGVYQYLAPGITNDTGWQSTALVEYLVYPVAESGERTVNVKMTDQLTFTIKAPDFKFRQMLATVKIAYHRAGDTAKVKVPFPFNEDSKDSLRGKLRLKQVVSDLFFSARLPDSGNGQPDQAYIDTLKVGYTLFNPENPFTPPTTSFPTFTHVVNKKHFRDVTDITSIINDWPDSMYIAEQITVPVGTEVLAVNDLQNPRDSEYIKYKFMGRMNIAGITTQRTNIMLGWDVVDTAKLDLGVGTFKVSKDLKYFDRMEDVKASLTMRMLNRTNLYMRLYTLVAPGPRIRLLKNMSFDSVLTLARDSGLAHQHGYMCLLGQKGISIPARGARDTSFIELKPWQIDSMFKYDSCAWRWEANFLPMPADTLRDTDLVYIQSWVHMEGINNMDSLLTWK
jgi:hypothetical protein